MRYGGYAAGARRICFASDNRALSQMAGAEQNLSQTLGLLRFETLAIEQQAPPVLRGR